MRVSIPLDLSTRSFISLPRFIHFRHLQECDEWRLLCESDTPWRWGGGFTILQPFHPFRLIVTVERIQMLGVWGFEDGSFQYDVCLTTEKGRKFHCTWWNVNKKTVHFGITPTTLTTSNLPMLSHNPSSLWRTLVSSPKGKIHNLSFLPMKPGNHSMDHVPYDGCSPCVFGNPSSPLGICLLLTSMYSSTVREVGR